VDLNSNSGSIWDSEFYKWWRDSTKIDNSQLNISELDYSDIADQPKNNQKKEEKQN